MFYGAIIAFGAFLYFVWKFLLAKSVRSRLAVNEPVLEEDKHVQYHEHTKKEINTENTVRSSDVTDNNLFNLSKDEERNTSKGYKYSDTKHSSQEKEDKQIENVLKIIEIQNSTLINPKLEIENFKTNELVSPSLLLNTKKEGNTFDINPSLQETKKEQIENELKILEIQNSTIITPKLEIEKFECEKLITPSLILKRNIENSHKKTLKRDSPPKERFAEFLEKTVLNDDKLQSIIQNLSLSDYSIDKQSDCSIEPVRSDSKPDYVKKESLLSENAVELQNKINKISDTFKHLNDRNDLKVTKNEETNEDSILEVNKPLLKRLQKQSGLPTGLNFGSVIGELKNRTKNASNGGLKPVFKKFETDTVDNQARNLQNSRI